MPWSLAAATAAPVAGVLLYAWLHGRPRLTRPVDGFTYIAVPVLVAWLVLPDAWREGRLLPVVAVVLGLLVVTAVERVFRARAARADDVAILAGMSGMVLHALLEGAAFAPSAGAGPGAAFVWATTMHRILVGSVIWWLLQPRHGAVAVGLGTAAICVATVAGYAAGPELFGVAGEGPGVHLYQAFVAGTLLHVVFHQGRRDHDHARDPSTDGSPPPSDSRTGRRE